ncbi:hypothetical protein [Streptomyces sp. NPDC006510]|uniref:hypothetical protein n=1 Tax=Streptomyces sp. NPDC006510 TaxID=3155600 RepID=UPI0033B1FCD6
MTPDDVILLMSGPAVRHVFPAVVLGAATPAEILSAPGPGAPRAAPAERTRGPRNPLPYLLVASPGTGPGGRTASGTAS